MARRTRITGGSKRMGTIFVALGVALIVLFVGVAVVVTVVQGQRTADWGTTTARVTGSEQGTMSSRRSNGRRSTQTSYKRLVTYTVDGRQYDVAVGPETSSRPETGTEVTVRYNPADPAEAVVDGQTGMVALLVGGIGAFIGLIFAGAGLLVRRRG